MNIIRKFIGRLRFPQKTQFTDNLQDVFLESVKETSHFDVSVKSLAQTWIAVCPHTYFSELFLKTENWNVPFVRAFERSDMVDAKVCFQLTQAFYLRNLFRVIINDEKYIKYAKDTITKNILSHMSAGSKILAFSNELEQAIKDMTSIEDFSMCYVKKILQSQYPDKNVLESIFTSIWMESGSLFGLSVFTAESIKRAKYIDVKSTLIS
jgi:hypothetical protein